MFEFYRFINKGGDMNPTTDHFHVPERANTRSNTRKIQVSNQENNGVVDIRKWSKDLSLVVELPIKTIYECLIFFNLYLIAFISSLYECLIFFHLYLIAFVVGGWTLLC